jgi:hypothetical protein
MMVLPFLRSDLGWILGTKSHCALEDAIRYLLHSILVPEIQLVQLVAVSLHSRQHLRPDKKSVEVCKAGSTS